MTDVTAAIANNYAGRATERGVIGAAHRFNAAQSESEP